MLTGEGFIGVKEMEWALKNPLAAAAKRKRSSSRKHTLWLHFAFRKREYVLSPEARKRKERQIVEALRADQIRRKLKEREITCKIDYLGELFSYRIIVHGWWAQERANEVLGPVVLRWRGVRRKKPTPPDSGLCQFPFQN